jgi:RHS repeat-associated protein
MERDEESGLSYHTARYYLPWLGRWFSSDPIGISGGINIFKYANNNPVNMVDTGGMQPEFVKVRETDNSDVHVDINSGVAIGRTQVEGGVYIQISTLEDGGYEILDEYVVMEAIHSTGKDLLPQVSTFTSQENANWVKWHQDRGLPVPRKDGSLAPVTTPENSASDSGGGGSLFDEVLQGDFYEGEPTLLGTVVSVGIGFTPLGVVQDVRDTAALIGKISRGEEVSVWDVATNVAGYVPGGDLLKGIKKGGGKALDILDAGSKKLSGAVPPIPKGKKVPKGKPTRRLKKEAQGAGMDPATNKPVKKGVKMEADHVYPKDLIKELPGFDMITYEQQKALLNYPMNFQGLAKSWNASKGNLLASEWAKTPIGSTADAKYLEWLEETQNNLEIAYKKQIQIFIKENAAKGIKP